MKQGMIFLAALVTAFALVLAPAAYAVQDTDLVNDAITGIDYSTKSGPGSDIAVSASGEVYVSFASTNDVKVLKGSVGTNLTTLRATGTVTDTVRLTALGITSSETVVAAVTNGRSSKDGDTQISLFWATTTGNGVTLRLIDTSVLGGLTFDTQSRSVTSMDLAVNDSFIIIVATLAYQGPLTGADAGVNVPNIDSFSTAIVIYRYDTSPIYPVVSSRKFLANSFGTVRDTGKSIGVQVVLDPVEGVNSDKLGTTVVWVGKTAVNGSRLADGAGGGDTGYRLDKFYIDINGNLTQAVTIIDGMGDTATIGRIAAENLSSTDTRAAITVSLTNLGGANATTTDTLVIFEFRDTRVSVLQPTFLTDFGRKGGLGGGDTIPMTLDTGGASLGRRGIDDMAYGRAGTVHYWILTVDRDTVLAVTSSSLSSFTTDTAVSASAGFNTSGRTSLLTIGNFVPEYGLERLASVFRFDRLHVVGFDDGPNRVYTTYLGGSSAESAKKNTGVCVLDRMFGQTSLRATFPALKMFRDTLLGTNLGRKLVNLYYSI